MRQKIGNDDPLDTFFRCLFEFHKTLFYLFKWN